MSRSHDARAPTHKNSKQQLARMRVPEMVKNGFTETVCRKTRIGLIIQNNKRKKGVTAVSSSP